MKSFSTVSAPIRYLAYATVMVMILCIVLEIETVPLKQHQPKANEIPCQPSEKVETNSKLFLSQQIKNLPKKAPIAGKFREIRLDTAASYLQNKVKSILHFYLYKRLFIEFSENQPFTPSLWITNQQRHELMK